MFEQQLYPTFREQEYGSEIYDPPRNVDAVAMSDFVCQTASLIPEEEETIQELQVVRQFLDQISEVGQGIASLYGEWREKENQDIFTNSQEYSLGRSLEGLVVNASGTTLLALGSKGKAKLFDSGTIKGRDFSFRASITTSSRLPLTGACVDMRGSAAVVHNAERWAGVVMGEKHEGKPRFPLTDKTPWAAGHEPLFTEDITFETPSPIQALSFIGFGDSEIAVCCTNGLFIRYSLENLSESRKPTEISRLDLGCGVSVAAWNSFGSVMVAIDKENRERVVALQDGEYKLVHVGIPDGDRIDCLALDERGEHWVTSSNYSLKVNSLELGSERVETRLMHEQPWGNASEKAVALSIDPLARHIAQVDSLGEVSVWNLSDQGIALENYIPKHTGVLHIKQVVLLPVGGALALGREEEGGRKEGSITICL
jgi:hypothetical protein